MQLVVGRVGRAHGIRGDVSVDVRTDHPALRFAEGASLATDANKSLIVAKIRWHSGRLLVHFVGIDTRTAAEGLRGVRLLSEIDTDRSVGESDEFYDHELVGLHVLDVALGRIGQVVEIMHSPGQDVLVVRGDQPQVLIPFVAALVTSVDLAIGQIHVDLPDGLLTLGEI